MPDRVLVLLRAVIDDLCCGSRSQHLGGRARWPRIGAGLVDECHLFLCPIVVGGGKRALHDNVRASSNSSMNVGSVTASFTSTTASASDRAGNAASGNDLL